jgi:hypothetical protein
VQSRGNACFSNGYCSARVDDLGCEPAYSTDSSISVVMARWNVEHRVFAVELFF